MRNFKIDRDPLGIGTNLYKKDSIDIYPGVTIVVGCNGSGKTTFLKCIKQILENENAKCIYFNNLTDGGTSAVSEAIFYGNTLFAAEAMCSSEGENIIMNICKLASEIGNFITKNSDAKELWILMDAIDSGLSIDNIIDIKDLFNIILKDDRNSNKDVYIIVNANSFELACDERCLDVRNMKYVNLHTYNAYKKFIMNSRESKDKRHKT